MSSIASANPRQIVSSMFRDRETRPVLFALALFLTGLAIYLAARNTTEYLIHDQRAVPAMAIALVISLTGIRIRASEVPRPIRILIYAGVLIFGVYVATSSLTIAPADTTDQRLYDIAFIARILGSAAAVLAIFRPSFAILLCTMVDVQKISLGQIGGISASQLTDWFICYEVTYLLTICLILYFAAESWRPGAQIKRYFTEADDGRYAWHVLDLVALFGVCVHLSNYLYAALAKFLLDGGPLSWTLENQTFTWMHGAKYFERFPFADLGMLQEPLYLAFEALNPVSNTVTIAAQAFAIIAVFRIRWTVWISSFYDVMHLSIFLVSGIMFWKWIFLNVGIVMAFQGLRDRTVPLLAGVIGSAIVFFAYFPFFITTLGWYDTRSFNDFQLYAETESGQRLLVPSNYFGFYSFRFIFDFDQSLPGHYQELRAAGGKSYAAMTAANECRLQPVLESTARNEFTIGNLETFVRKFHNYIIENVDEKGTLNYDLYPHHVWSSPFRFDAFKALDKRNIVAYVAVSRAICFPDGLDEIKAMSPTYEHRIPVRK